MQGASGAGRDRARERDDPRPGPRVLVERAEVDYLLQTGVPARWIPYLPRSSGYRAIELVPRLYEAMRQVPADPPCADVFQDVARAFTLAPASDPASPQSPQPPQR